MPSAARAWRGCERRSVPAKRISPEAAARNPKLAALDLRPGMTASVDIRTGQRSVLTYLIKPLARAFGGALNER